MDYQVDQLQRQAASSRRGIGALLSVVARRQTYLNLAYLVSAFPLGLFYFLFLMVGFAVGVSTTFIGVGILLLIALVFVVWGFAAFERELVMWWLNVRIAPMSAPLPARTTVWRRFLSLLRNPVMWKSLTYLAMEFPLGLISFVSVFALFALAINLIVLPVVYLGATVLRNASGDNFISTINFGIAINGTIEPLPLFMTVVLCIAGFLVIIGLLYAVNGLAFVWGRFARLMLGMSEHAQRLAEARAVATRERSRAERADQSRRELIVNVSHELRTPIANISGHVESLLMESGQQLSEAENKHYLEIIAREADRLSALIDDLLALARADADELKLDIRPISAGDVAEEVCQSLAPLARRDRQVKVVCSVAPNLPPALADRDRLAQVLLNLVRNAIAYTPAGGIVSLNVARADAGSLAILVADTGIGIPPEELSRIFDRFYRTDASRSRVSGGFGLGLSIARDLMQAMGGAISVSSKPGEGSLFRVTLRTA
jgi:two-component system, OmpR family, phosphate regulon sensor histidine kinase PhoR